MASLPVRERWKSLASEVNVGDFHMSARTVDRSRLGQVTVTIDILPDDALLEIFSFYVTGKLDTGAWRTLIRVCQRWRGLVFASPHHLNVRVVCTARTRMEEILAAWGPYLY